MLHWHVMDEDDELLKRERGEPRKMAMMEQGRGFGFWGLGSVS